ncbi:hypothetical protein NL676_014623 [Syzygium grande]|nr:hypothetical protein NL676_014623 [Syzygium grande]
MMEGKVPVIDIGDFPGQSQKLGEAFEAWGFFRIVNHKIPLKLMSEMKAVARSLLDLPSEIKRRNADVINWNTLVASVEARQSFGRTQNFHRPSRCNLSSSLNDLSDICLLTFIIARRIWSNGRWRNLKHRVLCKEAAIRVSIGTSILGPKQGVVEAPPALVNPKHLGLYCPVLPPEMSGPHSRIASRHMQHEFTDGKKMANVQNAFRKIRLLTRNTC